MKFLENGDQFLLKFLLLKDDEDIDIKISLISVMC